MNDAQPSIEEVVGLPIAEALGVGANDAQLAGLSALNAARSFVTRDIPSMSELETNVFDFVSDTRSRSAVASSFYSARWIGKVGLLLDRDPQSPGHGAHVRAQLFELRSTVEGCLVAMIRSKELEPRSTLDGMIEQARAGGLLSRKVLEHADGVRTQGNRVHTEVAKQRPRPRAEGDSRAAYMSTIKFINGCRMASGLEAWSGNPVAPHHGH